MNQKNVSALLKYFSKDSHEIQYSGVPTACESTITHAAVLKRRGLYDESLNEYFSVINKGYFTTEIGRMMAKTLCAMNEYQIALIILYECAKSKWEDSVGVNPMYSAIFGNAMDKFKHTLPTASANDFYLLRDAIIEAKNGNLSPLYERTKEVSGQIDYRNEKSNTQIIAECKRICQNFDL